MLYVVQTNIDLFNRARALEKKFNITLPLAGVVQNDMLITTENLNESFEVTHNKLLELQQLYLPEALMEIVHLQEDIKNYVLKSTLDASEDLIRQLCDYANHYGGQSFDYNTIVAELNKTRNDLIEHYKRDTY